MSSLVFQAFSVRQVSISFLLCRCYDVDWKARVIRETDEYVILDKPAGVSVRLEPDNDFSEYCPGHDGTPILASS